MTAPGWALQRALFAALAVDAGVKAALGDPPRLYDDPPPDAPFPFATLGEASETDWSTQTDEGRDHALVVHVWSRAPGRREAKLILHALRACLHEASPPLEGHRLVLLRAESADVLREDDGVTTHGVLRLRALTEPV